jgi:hypothetical protein
MSKDNDYKLIKRSKSRDTIEKEMAKCKKKGMRVEAYRDNLHNDYELYRVKSK